MRKVLIMFAMIGFTMSCTVNEDNVEDELVGEYVTMTNSESYQYDLGSFGDEEGAVFKLQANNSETSELSRADGQNIIFNYKPTAGYVGYDYVEVSILRGGEGTTPSTEVEIIYFTFVITD